MSSKNQPLTRDRLIQIINDPESADPYEVKHMASYTASAYAAMDDVPTLHEGNHCECALHLQALLKRVLRETPLYVGMVTKARKLLDTDLDKETEVWCRGTLHQLKHYVLKEE